MNAGGGFFKRTAEFHCCRFVAVIEEEHQVALRRIHLPQLQLLRCTELRRIEPGPPSQNRTQWMHLDRMLVVFLSRKTAKDNRTSFVKAVLICDRRTVTYKRQRTSRLILHFELLLKCRPLELRSSPFHCELFAGNQLFFAHSQHLV